MQEGTVKLNGYWYDLASKVVGAYHSRLPGKVNTGEDSYDNEQFLSNWFISDSRGGILVDEMDESVHADRCQWTNCIIDYDGHTTLPRLATEISTFTAADSWVSPDYHNDPESAWTDETNAYDRNTTSYAYDDVAYGATSEWLNLYVGDSLSDRGYSCDKVRFWYTASGTGISNSAVTIDLYYNGQWNTILNATLSARGEYVTAAIGSTVTVYAARIKFADGSSEGGSQIRLHEFDFNHRGTEGTITRFADFNGSQYMAKGIGLYKLATDRASYTRLKSFQTEITDLLTGPNNNLLIFLGDSDSYWYMSTAEAFTETNVNDATRGVLWDSKAWKMDADGNWWYTATPNSATPAWTSQTGITDIASQVERLEVGRDGDGDPAIYCSTNTWLKVFDFANNAWINTEVKLYGNQYHGQGFTYYNAAHYLSYGLGVKQYSAGSTGTLSDVGLNRDGGLPAEYNGIIVKMANGGDQLFILVDSSLTSGNSQSSLYAYKGGALTCWWAGPVTLVEDCEDAWNELTDADVTSAKDTTDYLFGTGSAKLTVAAGCGAGDILSTEAISSKDLSGYDTISLWLKSSVALNANDLQLLLDDTANCASPLETINISAVAADTWTRVDCTLAAAASDTAIISIGIKMAVDKGAFTLNIDRVEAVDYNAAMHDVIVTARSTDYAVYWDCGGSVYYIDMPEGLSNPKYLTGTQTYADSGIYLSPWFDGGEQAFQKLAKAIVSYAKGITTTETIAIKYRTDKTYTDRDSGWTVLDVLNATGDNGEVTNQISSGAGSGFNSFQFRLDFTRGSTTTLSPDMLSLALGYRLITQGNWSWTMTLLINGSHNTTAAQKWADLETAIESQTDIPFIFRFEPSEPHYCQFLNPREIMAAGKVYDGQITIQLLEPWLP